ncbi:MAG: hypothetical protein AB1938_07075 [Myxococcota bacterium]
MVDARDEVRRIIAFSNGDKARAFDVVEKQLSVLVLRTQVLLSLSGIVVTVTGFSGRTIAQTSEVARALIAVGIVVVLLSAGVAIGGVLRLKWLTQELGDDLEATLVRMLELRNSKAKFLSVALVAFVVGFGCYVAAIALMLAATPTAG